MADDVVPCAGTTHPRVLAGNADALTCAHFDAASGRRPCRARRGPEWGHAARLVMITCVWLCVCVCARGSNSACKDQVTCGSVTSRGRLSRETNHLPVRLSVHVPVCLCCTVCLSLFLAFSQPVCLFLSVCLPGIRRPVTKPLTHPHPIALYFTAGLCSGAPQHPALVVAICQGELQWHRCIQPGAYLEHIVCTTQGTPRWEIWQMVGSVMDEGHAKTRRPPKPLPVRGAESNKHNQHQTNSRADASPACPSAPSVRQPRQSRVVKRCVELRCVSLSHANNANVADS